MKKTHKILIGTHNLGKFREISALLPKKIFKISPLDLGLKEPKETGKSFKENSIIKAKYFYRKSQIPSISDDSGLMVECLKNKPGIHSARWAKKQGGFLKAMKKIIYEVNLENFKKKKKNRRAKFICSLCFINEKGFITNKTGIIKGLISNKVKGRNGFGYDSIFIPMGRQVTFGQMSKKLKMKIDHRYIAYQKIKNNLKFLK